MLHVPKLLNVEALLVRAGRTAESRERAERELRIVLGSRDDGSAEQLACSFMAYERGRSALEAEAAAGALRRIARRRSDRCECRAHRACGALPGGACISQSPHSHCTTGTGWRKCVASVARAGLR